MSVNITFLFRHISPQSDSVCAVAFTMIAQLLPFFVDQRLGRNSLNDTAPSTTLYLSTESVNMNLGVAGLIKTWAQHGVTPQLEPIPVTHPGLFTTPEIMMCYMFGS